MIEPGKYLGFVWASYAVAALVIAGLIVWLVRDGRRHAARLADLESRGIRRRSASNG